MQIYIENLEPSLFLIKNCVKSSLPKGAGIENYKKNDNVQKAIIFLRTPKEPNHGLCGKYHDKPTRKCVFIQFELRHLDECERFVFFLGAYEI